MSASRDLAIAVTVGLGGCVVCLAEEAPHAPDKQPPYHGLAIQIHSATNAVELYGRMIDEIAELGANTVLISVNAYQERIDSVLIETDPACTPTDQELLTLLGQAHDRGLRVILMPKILLRDARSGEWRGKIKPPTWDGWFKQYREFLLRYARLAQQGQVELFIIGSELVTTEKLTRQWLDTIDQVRRVYDGLLAYSANWDHYTTVQFWDKLDLIGLTSYFKLSDKPNPSRETLLGSWRKIQTQLHEFQRRVGKPLLFTEAGWCSQEGCSVEAWNYYRHEACTPAGLEEQRRNYEAFIDTWADDARVGGIIWWEWTDGDGGPKDNSYTPKNKPAERVLKDLFGRKARTSSDESTGPQP